MKTARLYIGIFFSFFIITLTGNTKTSDNYLSDTYNDFVYSTLGDWLIISFQEKNYKNVFNNLCVRDYISFTFNISESGNIQIKEFSKFIPESVKKFLVESTNKLNALELKKKPFISDWIEAKYFNKVIMQPVILVLFNDTCKTTDYMERGVLSMLTTQLHSGLPGIGPGQMNMSGGFNTPPFDGIVLPPFKIQTPFK